MLFLKILGFLVAGYLLLWLIIILICAFGFARAYISNKIDALAASASGR